MDELENKDCVEYSNLQAKACSQKYDYFRIDSTTDYA